MYFVLYASLLLLLLYLYNVINILCFLFLGSAGEESLSTGFCFFKEIVRNSTVSLSLLFLNCSLHFLLNVFN